MASSVLGWTEARDKSLFLTFCAPGGQPFQPMFQHGLPTGPQRVPATTLFTWSI